jgi:transcription antitermination factor NusG
MTVDSLHQPLVSAELHGIGRNPAPCDAHDSQPQEFSSKSKWGGARANSGGPRPNSGGARPNSGPKPKPKPLLVAPTYAPDPIRWCVVAFWGQAEISGTTELTRQGYDTYLPMVAIRRRDAVVPSMWHTVRVPYLPGYGFIHLTQRESREPILATRGVREVLLLPNGRAAYVPDAEIEKMQLGDEKRLLLPKELGPVMEVGTKVQVIDGPFTSFPGKVVQCDGVKTLVEVEMFGRTTPVWLDRTAVVGV